MTPWIESFVFGVANSLHCACMCGPLAIGMGGGTAMLSYHGGRALAYALVGTALGGSGALVGSAQVGTPTATVAFVLAAAIVGLVLFGESRALRIPGLTALVGRVVATGRSLPRQQRAALFGLLTPLLPCGLLWSALAAAAVAGSAWAGAQVMLGFALGSLPLLALAQQRAPALARRLPPRTLALVQRIAMLGAAGVLIWRGVLALRGDCCH